MSEYIKRSTAIEAIDSARNGDHYGDQVADFAIEVIRSLPPTPIPANFAELIAAAQMANGDHVAPHDCYATGPLTGNPITDLVTCPGCRLAAAIAAFSSSSKDKL